MKLRPIIKLGVLLFGASMLLNSFNSVMTLPRQGFEASLFGDGLWLLPASAVLLTALLFVYASKMALPDVEPLKGFVSGLIKLYGVYLLVTGLFMVVGGAFTLGPLSSAPELATEVNNDHQVFRPFVIGGLQLVIAYLFVFKASTIVRALKIRGDV